MEVKKWNTPQAIIVLSVIVVILAYIVVDVFVTKPRIESYLIEVKSEYVELSTFLDKKIPAIDSTFKNHANQLTTQKSQIDTITKKLIDPEN